MMLFGWWYFFGWLAYLLDGYVVDCSSNLLYLQRQLSNKKQLLSLANGKSVNKDT